LERINGNLLVSSGTNYMFFCIFVHFMLYLDSIITISNEGWIRFFLVQSSDSARSILSTISSAMMGVAGTVFSVTLVALTLASSQFGPRLIKNFMYVQAQSGSAGVIHFYLSLLPACFKFNNRQ
jgi:uncharacterized membrane protein